MDPSASSDKLSADLDRLRLNPTPMPATATVTPATTITTTTTATPPPAPQQIPSVVHEEIATTKPTTSTTSATITSATSDAKKTTTSSKYVRYFESIFVPVKIELLRNKAQSGQLRHCQFRSLCWRYFLHCLPEQYEDWLPACKRSRLEYEKIRQKHLGPIKSRSTNDDEQSILAPKEDVASRPGGLSTQATNLPTKVPVDRSPSQGSGYTTRRDQQQHREDSEEERKYAQASKDCDHKNVLRTIERDVVRTFPDMEFFRQTDMQNIMSNILFNYASENPHLSYKQGMHELIATLLYVAHTDSQTCLIHYEGDYANEAMASLLDLKYLEHDVYYLFCGLMKAIETWYQNDEILILPNENQNTKLRSNNELVNRSSSSSSSRSKLTSTRPQYSSVLGLKLKKISENIVKSYDSELFYHLEALQIAPQIYGIRWMRLLFGREFEFLDLLTVWDAIICDQDPMSLVDYVFASMLITIREELVNSDYTNCLNKLMRYQFKDVTYVIKLALYLRDPVSYSRPKSSNNQYTSGYPKAVGSNKYNVPHNHIRQPPPLKQTSKFGLKAGSGSPRNAFDVSTESYDDLHSIVDYCWRLLSEQIDSLQRCLPKEKGLSSEDEIFVALAQLKKVRDVLKGSLRLEDELESTAVAAATSGSKGNQPSR